MVEAVNAIELKNITKRFGEKVIANDSVNLTVRKGEILSLLGENGSGKTTLMNMLSGIYFPDEGQIFVNGKEVMISSPKDAFDLGIGMIHQHFKLIEVLTAAENIILGLPGKMTLNMDEVIKDIQALVDKYGFELDCRKKIYEMSVSEKQTVEIVKMLYRGSDILILDEPTAVLTPQETEKLFAVLRNMRADGRSIIIITHKLHEVLALSDRVSVLRKGKYIGTVNTCDATESSLTEMMVGEKVSLNIARPEPENPREILKVSGLTCLDNEGVKSLDDVSFTAFGRQRTEGTAGGYYKSLPDCRRHHQLCERAWKGSCYFRQISGTHFQRKYTYCAYFLCPGGQTGYGTGCFHGYDGQYDASQLQRGQRYICGQKETERAG